MSGYGPYGRHPVRADDRGGPGKALLAFTLVAAGELLCLFASSPWLLTLALSWLAAGLLLFVEEAFPGGCLAGVLWIACGAVGLWQREALGEWVATVKPWVMGVAWVAMLGLGWLAKRQREFRQYMRDVHGWP